MTGRLQYYWEKLRTSFWLLPLLMALGAVTVAMLLLKFDMESADGFFLVREGMLGTIGAEGAREVMAVIAGSMITIGGVAFSITIVALSLASNQLGPKVLRNFLRDTGNQIVLGTFIATFLYCLMVVRTISGTDSGAFVPHTSVTFGVLLALCSIGVLIYFIHHISTTIQADNVIALIAADLRQAIERETLEEQPNLPQHGETWDDVMKGREARTLCADRSGYVQTVDYERLYNLAVELNISICVTVRPGDFIIEGMPTLLLSHLPVIDNKALEVLKDSVVLGRERTPVQDPGFAIVQLVQVASRALSPGINDQVTAGTCIDWMGAGLAVIACRFPRPTRRYDGERVLRLTLRATSFPELLELAFGPVRRFGVGSTSVMILLLETLRKIALKTDRTDRLSALREQADTLRHSCFHTLSEPGERQAIRSHYNNLLQVIARQAADTPPGHTPIPST